MYIAEICAVWLDTAHHHLITLPMHFISSCVDGNRSVPNSAFCTTHCLSIPGSNHRTSPLICSMRKPSSILPKFLSAPTLVQVARLSMAFFQVGTIATPELVRPLYTSEVFAHLSPALLAALRTIGVANIALFFALRSNPQTKNVRRLIDMLTMSITGIIYTVFPMKPPLINVPFVGSLFILSALTVLRIGEVEERNANIYASVSIWSQIAHLGKLFVGILALLFVYWGQGDGISGIIGIVYWLQIAMVMSVWAFVSRGQPTTIVDIAGSLAIAVSSFRADSQNVAMASAIAGLAGAVGWFLRKTSAGPSHVD